MTETSGNPGAAEAAAAARPRLQVLGCDPPQAFQSALSFLYRAVMVDLPYGRGCGSASA